MKHDDEPRWRHSERWVREAKFVVKGVARDVFPLLCPVREYEWLPGWKCEMAYSKSGAAEMNAIFYTREMHSLRVVWTLITFEPDSRIEYLLVAGQHSVVRLSLGLSEPAAGKTEIDWQMLFTATSALGRKLLSAAFTEEKFQEMMHARQAELDHFLESGTKIRR
jgi:hypothetical protein